MNAKLSGLALAVSAVALLVAVVGSIYTIMQAPTPGTAASAPQTDAPAPQMAAGVQGELVRSAEAIQARVDNLERQNADLRESLATAQTRLNNVETRYDSTEDQLETVTTEIAKLEKSSAETGRAMSRFGRSQAVLRQRLGISDTELDEEAEDEEPKLEDFLSIELEPINGLPGPHIIFEGVNLHVRSGSGGTDDLGGILYGLGNFVIGYNEEDPTQFRARTGSHNLIVGSGHGYTSFGGLVAGYANEVNAPSSTVSGGTGNAANGVTSSISGGSDNEAKGWASSVTGGRRNFAKGDSSSVAGGAGNQSLANFCSIAGGIDENEDKEGFSRSGQTRLPPTGKL